MEEDHSSCGIGPVIPLAATKDVLGALKKMSSAEDFFTGLGVAYDPSVLSVARLHILKRMGQYVGGDDLDDLPDRVVIARARSYLERAYQDFVASGQFVFRGRGDVVRLGDVIKFHWEAVTPDGETGGVGLEFLVIGEDGRIRLDYQFIEG